VCDKSLLRCFSISSDLEKYFYDHAHHTLAGASFFGRRVDEVGWLHRLTEIPGSAASDNKIADGAKTLSSAGTDLRKPDSVRVVVRRVNE
ncbi:MAG: hypothetical protein AAF629_29625, partial [Chloroflexota bacterium]